MFGFVAVYLMHYSQIIVGKHSPFIFALDQLGFVGLIQCASMISPIQKRKIEWQDILQQKEIVMARHSEDINLHILSIEY